MEYVFTPTVCKDREVEKEDGTKEAVKATFKGTVTVRLASFDERCEYSEKVILAGETTTNEDLKKLRRLQVSVACSKPHYVAVNLERLSDGKKYSNFDEVGVGQVGLPILYEVAGLILDGPAEGND